VPTHSRPARRGLAWYRRSSSGRYAARIVAAWPGIAAPPQAATRPASSRLAGVEVGALQHVVHGLRVHPEGSPHSDCRQLTVVNQPVDRHLADPHQRCHFGHSQELRPGRLAVYGTRITSRFTASRIPCRWPVHRRHRNPISQASAVPAASPPLAPTGAYQEENSGTSGVTATGEGK